MIWRNSAKFILILVYCVIFIIAAELALRFVFPYSNKYYLWPPNRKVIIKPYPGIMSGLAGNTLFETNSDGVRGDELTGKHYLKVLAVGGSTTECLYIDQKKTWPNILQNNLTAALKKDVWVGNIGRSGLSTTANSIELKYLLPQYKKIDLVIALVGFNDLQSALLNTYIQNNLKSEREKIEMLFMLRPCGPGGFYRNSKLLVIVKKLISYLFKIKKGINEDDMGSWCIEARNSRKRALKIDNNLPDLSSSLALFEGNINQMIDLAEARSIRIIFITQPYIWNQNLTASEKELLWCGFTADKERYYSIDALVKGLDKFNLRLLEVCKRRNVECIDLVKIIPQNTGFFYDDVHFNEGGCRKIAGIISAYLVEGNKISGQLN